MTSFFKFAFWIIYILLFLGTVETKHADAAFLLFIIGVFILMISEVIAGDDRESRLRETQEHRENMERLIERLTEKIEKGFYESQRNIERKFTDADRRVNEILRNLK